MSIEPELRYLDRTDNQGRYEFAVVGSLALRIRDTSGIMLLQFL